MGDWSGSLEGIEGPSAGPEGGGASFAIAPGGIEIDSAVSIAFPRENQTLHTLSLVIRHTLSQVHRSRGLAIRLYLKA